MKKILSIILLVCSSYLLRAQFSITQNLGSPNTLVKNPNYGGLQGGLIPFTFTDTSSANTLATALKTYSGALIYTTSPRAVWWRDAAVSQWIQVLPGGGTGALGAWTTTLNTTIPTDLSLNGYFGTTDANGIGFYTTNTQRVILPAGGLTLKAVVSDTTLNKPMVWNTSTKEWNYGYWYGGGSGTTPISSLTAAAASNSISNANYTQQWGWALTGGNVALALVNTTTTAVGNEKVFEISTNGAHSSNNITTFGQKVTNSHTGTGSINIALQAQAVNGDENISFWANRGKVRFGTNGTEKGVLEILGNTSGTITIQPQPTAGTYNLNLPTTAGTSGYLLTSAGGGASPMTWTDPASLSTSLTSTYIGYGSAGNAVTGDANLTYTAASSAVVIDSGYLSFTGHKAYGSTVTGSIFKHADYGLTTRAVTGTTYDWLMFSTGGNTVLANPTGTDNFLTSGRWGFGSLGLTPTAKVHIAAGSTSASTAPLKFVSGSLMTTAEAGAVEFLTDKAYLTITTGAARKELTLNDAALTSGRVPYVTTNGRLTDDANFAFGGGAFSLTANGGLDALSTGATTLGDYNNATGIQISGSNASDAMTYKSATTHTFSTGTVTMSAYGAGTATFDGSGNITSVSDMRLKDLQGMYEIGINRILKINPIVYKWNEKSKLERKLNYIGFSAQNVKDALGESSVGINKDGYYSLQDRAIIAALVNGEKDLYKIIEAQQKQIDEMEKKINKLTKK